MKNYEMVTILDPGLDSAQFLEKSKFLEERIKNFGGEIQNVSHWGKRKLAYDIKKKDAGYYVVINFQGTSEGLLDFKDSIKHDLEILRYLVVVKKKPPVFEEQGVASGAGQRGEGEPISTFDRTKLGDEEDEGNADDEDFELADDKKAFGSLEEEEK